MPFVVSKNPVIQAVLADALLAALSARPAAALLNAPVCRLYQAGPANPGPHQVAADFTIADFDGYADVVLGALIGPISLLSAADGLHVEADFLSANPQTKPQNIIGYIITDTTKAIVYQAEAFASAIAISSPGNYLSLDIIFAQTFYPQVTTG